MTDELPQQEQLPLDLPVEPETKVTPATEVESDLTPIPVDELKKKPWLFQKGQDARRNVTGANKGHITVVGKLKQIFRDNPDKFTAFVLEYLEDPANRKHVAEMLDGKPRQNIGLDGGAEGLSIQFSQVFSKVIEPIQETLDVDPAPETRTDNPITSEIQSDTSGETIG